MEGKLISCICTSLIFLFVILNLSSVSALPIASFFFNTSGQAVSLTINEPFHSGSVLFQILTDKPVTCKYSELSGLTYGAMDGNFDYSFGNVQKKGLLDLSDGTKKIYVKCKDAFGIESAELETIFLIINPVSAKISLSKDPPLGVGQFEVSVTPSKAVSETPSLWYALDGTSYTQIPLYESGSIWKGYLLISSSTKEAVGSFKFSAKDLEGYTGTDISSGAVFLVDTVIPATIVSLEAMGEEGRIELEWHLDESVDHYSVYRSIHPNVGYTDFYKNVDDEKFIDTEVTKGKTYYYRVNAVDKAGNEGPLSIEVESTPLLSNSSIISNGLAVQYHSLVDSVISQIDTLQDTISDASYKLDQLDGLDQTVAQRLVLSAEIDAATNELAALRRDVSSYKSQNMNLDELQRKLNSAELRQSGIKKKVPESFSIVSQKNAQASFSADETRRIMLEIDPSLFDSSKEKKLSRSIEYMEAQNFKASTTIFNVRVGYLDGSSAERAVVTSNIEPSMPDNENVSLVYFVPKELAQSVGEMEIKNNDYRVLKDDPVLAFRSNTAEITFVLNDFASLDLADDIKIALLEESPEASKKSSLTGYSVLVDSASGPYSGLVFGLVVLFVAGIYFLTVRRKRIASEVSASFKERINSLEGYLRAGKVELAQELYAQLVKEYLSLNTPSKRMVHPQFVSLRSRLEGANEILSGK